MEQCQFKSWFLFFFFFLCYKAKKDKKKEYIIATKKTLFIKEEDFYNVALKNITDAFGMRNTN
jgi:hypothetical protein